VAVVSFKRDNKLIEYALLLNNTTQKCTDQVLLLWKSKSSPNYTPTFQPSKQLVVKLVAREKEIEMLIADD
jgi:hypothetical protein